MSAVAVPAVEAGPPRPLGSRHRRPAATGATPAEVAPVRVAPLGPADRDELVAMMRRCSPLARHRRFHGPTDAVAYIEHTLREVARSSDQEAYGAWIGGRCVGLANLADDGEGATHLGVLVEDAWQGRGIGSALVALATRRARQEGRASIVADVMADDRYLLLLLRRIGRLTTTVAQGGYQVRIDLASVRAA